MAEEEVAASKELAVSLVGLVTGIILAYPVPGNCQLGNADLRDNWRYAKGAALTAVAVIIGQTIAVFANKKHF